MDSELDSDTESEAEIVEEEGCFGGILIIIVIIVIKMRKSTRK